jgi:hypothetical protein
VVISGVNPHRFRFSGSFKPHGLIKIDGVNIRCQHLLVKVRVSAFHRFHHFSADPLALVLRVDQHMRVVNDEVAIRDCIADTDKPARYPRRYQ